MSTLILEPSALASWHNLVKEAEQTHHYALHEDLESYLVFLLMRFTCRPEIAKSVMALDFLHTLEQVGREKVEALHDVADKCLLYAGLFPGRAQRRRVRVSYFVELGQQSYSALSVLSKHNLAGLYAGLNESFVALMDVLQVIRELTGPDKSLTLLEAEELWNDTGSLHALTVLRRATQSSLLQKDVRFHHIH